MHDDTFILDAWQFSHGAPPVKIRHVGQFQPDCWYHCRRDQTGLADWLSSIGMHESLVEMLVADDTRSHFQFMDDDNFLLILRGVNLNEGDDPDDMISLRIAYYQSSVITLRRKPFKGIALTQKQLEQQGAPVDIPGLLLSFLENTNRLIEEVLDDVEQGIDDIEENIDRLDRQQQRRLTLLHRRLLKLHRFLKPQTAAIQSLFEQMPEVLQTYTQRLLNQKEISQRINESIEANLLQVSMLRNDLQQSVAERMNRNSYYLSLTAGVFLPLSFFTGLFGINIGGMPGVDHPQAFSFFCMAMSVLGLTVFLLLRRLRFW